MDKCLVAALVCCLVFVAIVIYSNLNSTHTNFQQRIQRYHRMHVKFERHEYQNQIGGYTLLEEQEVYPNKFITFLKEAERVRHHAIYAQNTTLAYDRINQTLLFALLRSMPKGGLLYARDMTLGGIDILMRFTDLPNLWVCEEHGNSTYDGLSFSVEEPYVHEDQNCVWNMVSELIDIRGEDAVNKKLRERFEWEARNLPKSMSNLRPGTGLSGSLTYDLLSFAPVWQTYFLICLDNMYHDGVFYLEMKTSLPMLYDLTGRNFTSLEMVDVIDATTARFREKHPDFIGVKLIYAPLGSVGAEQFANHIGIVVELAYLYPNIFAGFDLSGLLDSEHVVADYTLELLELTPLIKFYFHPIESQHLGYENERDISDAIFLGAKNVGVTSVLLRHPYIMHYMKRNKIPTVLNVEACGLLKNITEFSDPTCQYLMARNYPLLLTATPRIDKWKTTPFTHDFFILYVHISSEMANIRMMKQIAKNSLYFSALDEVEQPIALEMFEERWKNWTNYVAQSAAEMIKLYKL